MKIIDNLTKSRKVFFEYIDICNRKYRHGDDLRFYRELVAQHRTISDLNTMISSEAFLKKLYATLEKWDMNKRGARLVDLPIFCESIRSYKEDLCKLYKYRLEMLLEEDIPNIQKLLKNLFCGLKIMASNRRIVRSKQSVAFFAA